MSTVSVPVQRLQSGADLALPSYATMDAAGMDLLAAVDGPVNLPPGSFQVIPTGIAIALPRGYEAQVRPRSGLAAKHGVTVLNSPGTIDADYRGEVGVILINHGKSDFIIDRGMRIAQLILAPVNTLEWQEVAMLDESDRGTGGFGSTGTQG